MAQEKKTKLGNTVDDIVFREAKSGDEMLVNAFFDSLGAESRALFDRTGYNRNKMLAFCKKYDATKRYWVALMDEKIAGIVFFAYWNTTIPSLGIAVSDDVKGKHLGSRLMDLAIENARSARKGGIRLTTHFANLRGQMLYEKKGFHCMGQYTNGQEFFYLLWFEDHA